MTNNFDTLAQPLQASSRTVRVKVAPGVTHNLENMQKVTKDILGKLGCPNCHSGFDLRFEEMLEFSVDEKLNIRGVAGGF